MPHRLANIRRRNAFDPPDRHRRPPPHRTPPRRLPCLARPPPGRAFCRLRNRRSHAPRGAGRSDVSRWPVPRWPCWRRGAWYARDWWTTGRFIESTDDAYVGGNVTALAPHVSGFIAEVLVTDNQRVQAGQVLIRLDPRDYPGRARPCRRRGRTPGAPRSTGCARNPCCSNPPSASRRRTSPQDRRS